MAWPDGFGTFGFAESTPPVMPRERDTLAYVNLDAEEFQGGRPSAFFIRIAAEAVEVRGVESSNDRTSRGGLTTKIHARVDALGNRVQLELTEGQRHDCTVAKTLVEQVGHAFPLVTRSSQSTTFSTSSSSRDWR